MALQATHIRFALDLKDEYEIKNIGEYIRGAVYPDSRYVSGIDRSLTHGDDILSPRFAADDFKKGWQAHQICDFAQYEIMTQNFGGLFAEKNEDHDKEKWIVASSIKIIEDMSDLKYFDLQGCLKYLAEAKNPNGENIEDVKNFYNSIKELYKDIENISLADYYEMWSVWGIGEELGKKIKEKTEEFLKDESLVKKIESMYQQILNEYKKFLTFNQV